MCPTKAPAFLEFIQNPIQQFIDVAGLSRLDLNTRRRRQGQIITIQIHVYADTNQDVVDLLTFDGGLTQDPRDLPTLDHQIVREFYVTLNADPPLDRACYGMAYQFRNLFETVR